MATDQPPRSLTYVRLDDVTPAPRNPKVHDDAGISRSIKHHGLGEVPLRDDRTGRLVAGHGRHAQLVAMHAAGATPPDGVTVDSDGTWMMPVVTGWSSRSDEDAEAYLVGSNHLTDLGGWDDRELAEVLADLAGVNLLELTGFHQVDLDDLLAEMEESTRDTDGTATPMPGGSLNTSDGPSIWDLKDRYEGRETRQIVLTYTVDTFEWLVGQLADLADKYTVDSNSDVIMHLVRTATGNAP